jgi:hypothetical protein
MWDEDQGHWVGEDGSITNALPSTYWYAAPVTTRYVGPNMPPLSWAIVLHNARIASGLHIPAKSMHASIGNAPGTLKTGPAKEAEDALEAARVRVKPAAPSRLACFFLSADQKTAEYRWRADLRGDRVIVPCRILMDGPAHQADIRLYDRLVSSPNDGVLAERYWQWFDPSTEEDRKHVEILAGGSLYFPGWETFANLDTEEVSQWNAGRSA